MFNKHFTTFSIFCFIFFNEYKIVKIKRKKEMKERNKEKIKIERKKE
jgi:hypothetical protein